MTNLDSSYDHVMAALARWTKAGLLEDGLGSRPVSGDGDVRQAVWYRKAGASMRVTLHLYADGSVLDTYSGFMYPSGKAWVAASRPPAVFLDVEPELLCNVMATRPASLAEYVDGIDLYQLPALADALARVLDARTEAGIPLAGHYVIVCKHVVKASPTDCPHRRNLQRAIKQSADARKARLASGAAT